MNNNDILRQLSEVADSSMVTEPSNDDLLEIKRLVNQLKLKQSTCPYCHNNKGHNVLAVDNREQSVGMVDVCDEPLYQNDMVQDLMVIVMNPFGHLLCETIDEEQQVQCSFVEANHRTIELTECPMCHRKLGR